jgi:gamma-glutamylcyclotransferase (GGCT)/AIG2-like uncharacterized protein YtfP
VKATLRRLFVYGSLRRGEENHDRWFGSGATHVADGRIRGAELVSLGAYCCIVSTDDLTRTVMGEVYDVVAEVFTGIEGMEADAGYVRQPVRVHPIGDGPEGPPILAEAYFYAKPQRVARRPRVESGDWIERKTV